jgi:hypothetical protein
MPLAYTFLINRIQTITDYLVRQIQSETVLHNEFLRTLLIFPDRMPSATTAGPSSSFIVSLLMPIAGVQAFFRVLSKYSIDCRSNDAKIDRSIA